MCNMEDTSCKPSCLVVVFAVMNHLYRLQSIPYSREWVDVQAFLCSKQWGDENSVQNSGEV